MDERRLPAVELQPVGSYREDPAVHGRLPFLRDQRRLQAFQQHSFFRRIGAVRPGDGFQILQQPGSDVRIQVADTVDRLLQRQGLRLEDGAVCNAVCLTKQRIEALHFTDARNGFRVTEFRNDRRNGFFLSEGKLHNLTGWLGPAF